MTKSIPSFKVSPLPKENNNSTICSACKAKHIPKSDQNGLCFKCHLFSIGAKHNEIAKAYFKAYEAATH